MNNREKKKGLKTDITATSKTEINRMEKPEANKYFFSFLDVLGFTNIMDEKNLQDIHSSIVRVLDDLPNIYFTRESNRSYEIMKSSRKRDPPAFVSKILEENYANFSDTIIFYIPIGDNQKENTERFESICWLSNWFIAKSLIQPKDSKVELPFRCGIAFGDALIDEKRNLHLGQPLIDAHKFSECQKWMGGGVHESVPEKYIGPLKGHDKEIYDHEIPFKDKCKDKYEFDSKNALNWVKHHHTTEKHPAVKYKTCRKGPTLRDLGSHVRQHDWVEKNMNEEQKKKGKEKKENTLQFIKEVDDAWNEEEGVEQSTEVAEWMTSRWPEEYNNSEG